MVALGGLDVPSSMQGRDLGPLLADPDAEWRDEIFIESLFLLRTGPYMEAVRTKDWKYVRYFRSDKAQYSEQDVDFRGRQPDFEQFFDLSGDPGEETNLIAEPNLQERVERLRERCRQHSAALVLARKDHRDLPTLAHRLWIVGATRHPLQHVRR